MLLTHSYHLTYHSARQVIWGVGIGMIFGSAYYTLVELIPSRAPNSLLGRARSSVLSHPVSIWLRIRDGWSVYPDGGTEEQWKAWKIRWDVQQSGYLEQRCTRKMKKSQ
jgi:dolichyldiphosphatase